MSFWKASDAYTKEAVIGADKLNKLIAILQSIGGRLPMLHTLRGVTA